MNERLITITVSEYKALIEFKVKTEVEARYEKEIAKLMKEIDEARDENYWYDRFCEMEKKYMKLKEEV